MEPLPAPFFEAPVETVHYEAVRRAVLGCEDWQHRGRRPTFAAHVQAWRAVARCVHEGGQLMAEVTKLPAPRPLCTCGRLLRSARELCAELYEAGCDETTLVRCLRQLGLDAPCCRAAAFGDTEALEVHSWIYELPLEVQPP
jgi:hypothetical protein